MKIPTSVEVGVSKAHEAIRVLPCGRARRGVPHKPHVHRSAITLRFVHCDGGPALRWEGDDA